MQISEAAHQHISWSLFILCVKRRQCLLDLFIKKQDEDSNTSCLNRCMSQTALCAGYAKKMDVSIACDSKWHIKTKNVFRGHCIELSLQDVHCQNRHELLKDHFTIVQLQLSVLLMHCMPIQVHCSASIPFRAYRISVFLERQYIYC